MKIPFDIKYRPQIESGEYRVVTTKGQSVRIICWDRSTTYWKIIALVLAPDGETENPFTYDVNGKESDGCLHNHELDLFIVTPEPELSEFEKALKDCVNARNPENPMTDEGARNNATILLALARKELEPEIKAEALKEIEQDPESSYAFKRGVEYGKEEALKDLPRWKTLKEPDDAGRAVAYVGTNMIGEKTLYVGNKCISVNKLKILPGFNEDEK